MAGNRFLWRLLCTIENLSGLYALINRPLQVPAPPVEVFYCFSPGRYLGRAVLLSDCFSCIDPAPSFVGVKSQYPSIDVAKLHYRSQKLLDVYWQTNHDKLSCLRNLDNILWFWPITAYSQ